MPQPCTQPRHDGFVVLLFLAGMLVLLGSAGLALDSGHIYLDRTRLQNAVDAAALDGAKRLDAGGPQSTLQSALAAQAGFDEVAGAPGNEELQGIRVAVTFSSTASPFLPGSTPALFIRVSVDHFQLAPWLMQTLGSGIMNIKASAVAGPSPTLSQTCGITPIAVCGIPGSADFGLSARNLMETTRGREKPGHFLVMPGDCGSSDSCIRSIMAGAYTDCIDTPGTAALMTVNIPSDEPIAEGLNTRFNCPGGTCGGLSTLSYPSDVITESGISHGTYQSYSTLGQYNVSPPAGEHARRIIKVPVVACPKKGSGEVDFLGLACLFLTDRLEVKTNMKIAYEYISQCFSAGTPGPHAMLGGPHTIILYRDFTDGSIS